MEVSEGAGQMAPAAPERIFVKWATPADELAGAARCWSMAFHFRRIDDANDPAIVVPNMAGRAGEGRVRRHGPNHSRRARWLSATRRKASRRCSRSSRIRTTPSCSVSGGWRAWSPAELDEPLAHYGAREWRRRWCARLTVRVPSCTTGCCMCAAMNASCTSCLSAS